MPVTVRRTRSGTLSALANFVLGLLAGTVVLGNQWVAADPAVGWIVAGLLLLLWSGVVLSALLRPVLAVADAEGLAVRRLLGRHRFAWDSLVWADFDTSARAVIVAARQGGRQQFAALPKRPVSEDDLAALRQAVAAKRPDLPGRNPDQPQQPEAS